VAPLFATCWHPPCALFAMVLNSDCVAPRNVRPMAPPPRHAQRRATVTHAARSEPRLHPSGGGGGRPHEGNVGWLRRFATSKGFRLRRQPRVDWFTADSAAIVSDLPTRTFQRRAAPWLLPPDVPRVSVHRASLTPCDPPRAPTTKDFAEKGGSVEIGQSSWLSAPDRPEQSGGKFDLLLFNKGNQISDDGARLIRIVRRVADDRGAARASRLECTFQMIGFGGVEWLPRDVTGGFRMPFRIEIAQPHVDPKGRQAAAERPIAATRNESEPRQFES
jgi:hypothetical protein